MKRSAALLGALALAATAWTAGTAHAAPASPAGVRQTSVSAAQQSAAERFWTPERLRGAKDVTDLPAATGTAATRTTAAPAASGSRVAVPPVAGPRTTAGGRVTPMSSPTAWNGGGLISTTAGKVFFQNSSGGTFACSATVANADNKSVVLTAGHCIVNAGTGESYQNWVFIPGYNHGNRPFGTFSARVLYWWSGYVSTAGNANWDFAYAVVNTVNGRSLVDTVGAEGIAFNSPTGQHVHSFGYGGSDAEGNGEQLNHCEGTEYPDAGRGDSTMWGIDCVQTGGSSGGGFLSNFDTGAGTGYLVGNISVSSGNNEYHPYLGDEALTTYQAAGAA
ncbi:trypsin-like serine peptidase [Streptomyces sp. NPDC008317]|uniref:trypsin-like serine peptidase n=1 Tax=Streptomyces sp. NPDC008317 TaxID=3364827 RepID=UPI0036DFD8C3